MPSVNSVTPGVHEKSFQLLPGYVTSENRNWLQQIKTAAQNSRIKSLGRVSICLKLAILIPQDMGYGRFLSEARIPILILQRAYQSSRRFKKKFRPKNNPALKMNYTLSPRGLTTRAKNLRHPMNKIT